MSFKEELEQKKKEITSKEYLSNIVKDSIRKETNIHEDDVTIKKVDESILSDSWDALRNVLSESDFESLSFSVYNTVDTIYLFVEKDGDNYVYEINDGEIVDSMEGIEQVNYQQRIREVIEMGAKQITSKKRIKSIFIDLGESFQLDASFSVSPIRIITDIFTAASSIELDDINIMGVYIYEFGGDIVIERSNTTTSEDDNDLIRNIIDETDIEYKEQVNNFIQSYSLNIENQSKHTIKTVATVVDSMDDAQMEFLNQFSFVDIVEVGYMVRTLTEEQIEYLYSVESDNVVYVMGLFYEAGEAGKLPSEYLEILSTEDLQKISSVSDNTKEELEGMSMSERVSYISDLLN